MQTMLERKRLHCGDVGRKRPWQAPAQVGGPPRTCMFDAAVGDLTGECWAWEQVSYTMSVCIPEGVSLWAFLNGLVGRGPYRIRNPVPSGWQRHGAAGCEGVCVRVRLTLGKVTFLPHPAWAPAWAKHVIISVLGDAEATWRPFQLLVVDRHQGQGRVAVPRDAASLPGGDLVRAEAVQFSLEVVALLAVCKCQNREDGGPFCVCGCRGGKSCLNLSRTGSSLGQVRWVVGKKPIGANFVNGQLVEAVGELVGACLGIAADDGFQARTPVVLLQLGGQGGTLGGAGLSDAHLQPLHVLHVHIHKEVQFLPHVVDLPLDFHELPHHALVFDFWCGCSGYVWFIPGRLLGGVGECCPFLRLLMFRSRWRSWGENHIYSCLKVLYPGKHVKVSCGILLNHILHIIRPQSLLEFFFIETEL